jgi:hypothetical protein
MNDILNFDMLQVTFTTVPLHFQLRAKITTVATPLMMTRERLAGGMQ